MSTRCSFGHSDEPGKEFHLFEDYHDEGFVFLELPRAALDELDLQTVLLRLTPEQWAEMRKHGCPNMVPAGFWKNYKFYPEFIKRLPGSNQEGA